MPVLSMFYGLIIKMYSRESGHNVPHIHIEYSGQKAAFAFDGTLLEGDSLPPLKHGCFYTKKN